jgi:hypothetical protein
MSASSVNPLFYATLTPQHNPLSSYTPESLGAKKRARNDPPQDGPLEDDEYVVEQPVLDENLLGMMPMSFGKQDRKKDLASSFAKTKRGVTNV